MKNSISNKLVCFFAVISIYGFFTFVCSIFSDSKPMYCISTLISIISVMLIMTYMDKKELISISLPIVKSPSMIWLILLLSINYKFLIASISNVLSFGSVSQSGSNVELSAWFLIDTIVIGPVSEELLYRFAIPNIFIKNKDNVFSKIILAVIVTLFWSFRHGDGFISLNINISLILGGFILYWIYFKTQNIIYSIVFHMAANTANVLMFYWDKTSELIAFMYNSKIALLINGVAFVTLMFLINSEMKKYSQVR